MAIIEMKRLSLLALKKHEERLLSALQEMESVQIGQALPELAQQQTADALTKTQERLSGLQWALARLKPYNTEKAPSFGLRREISRQEADDVLSRADEYADVVARLEREEHRAGEIKSQQLRLRALSEQLTPWKALDVAVETLTYQTRYTRQFTGYVPTHLFAALEEALAPLSVRVCQVGIAREGTCVYGVCAQSDFDACSDALKNAGFAPMQFSGFTGTAAQRIAQIQDESRALDAERADMLQKRAELAGSVPGLKILIDVLSMRVDRLQAARMLAQTETAFYLCGWAPAKSVEAIEKVIRKIAPECALEFRDPLPDENPPVKLENNAFATPFEVVVEGFAMPDYRSVDPTAVMAPFYACLFGMMVSDAGYGLLMLLLIPLFVKKMGIKRQNARMLWLLAIGGAFTVLWGALYNTWFGFAPWPSVFDPVNDSLPVMILCMGVGALHLFTGLGMAAYLNIKRGKPWSAVFDQLSWVMLLAGLGMLILPATAQIGQILALCGAGIILVTAGREKSKNPFKRLISGFGALYGITSWVSDLLSYMRLFGMGLATGVIGMVINKLVGMVFEAGVVGIVIGSVIFVFAHLFNLGINVLGAYVHACRLQYIEFFGKFYEEGGKPFRPLRRNTRFVSIGAPQSDP